MDNNAIREELAMQPSDDAQKFLCNFFDGYPMSKGAIKKLALAITARDASIRAETRAEALRETRMGCQSCEVGVFDYISKNGIGFCMECGGIARIPGRFDPTIIANELKERDTREGLLYKSDVNDRG